MILIKKKGERLAVYEDGKLGNQGFLTVADCLHSIWVDAGKVPSEFYSVDDLGKVYLEVVEI